MNNQSMTLFRTLFLILAAASFLTIGTQPTSVFADGEETPLSQESARESVASCDNITYKVPPVPVDVEGSEHFAIPPNSEGPVLADIGLYIEEIPEVNEIDNTFTVEGLMNIVWCDPRLKYEDRGQGEFEILLEEGVREKFSVIWWPDITFANEVEGRDIADEELVIHENGTLEYREKFSVVLEATYDLSKFPFDEQTLEIEIESFAWDEGSLELHINENFSGFSDRFQIPEWRWQEDNVTTRIEDRMEKGDRTPFSEFLMSIHITRQSGFSAAIYAELIGFCCNAHAYHISAPSPNGIGAAKCMEIALKDARITYDQVDYINAHGTSTPLNDLSETMAMKTVFKDRAKKIAVSSTKSITGHLLGAAGGVEAIFSVLAISRGIIPPTINYETPDPECDLDYVPNTPREAKVRVVMSNSFGFGGTNATLIFREFKG